MINLEYYMHENLGIGNNVLSNNICSYQYIIRHELVGQSAMHPS